MTTESGQMLALGKFKFEINTAAYQTFQRTANFKWQSQERIGRRPAQQYVGRGDETINLNGVMYPHFGGGIGQINAMVNMAAEGTPLDLLDGKGNSYGQWVITSVGETRTIFFSNGAPRKIEFRISIKNYGADET